MKASNLLVSNVRQLSQSKPTYTIFNVATGKFTSKKAFDRLRNDFWCMNLAYVDKLANDINGVKYLLVRQDMFARTVDAKIMKTKNSKEMVRAFLTKINKKIQPKRLGRRGRRSSGEFKKLRKAEGIQIDSTMSETKAAFAEGTKGSLKNNSYRYLEVYVYKYSPKLTQFVTTQSSRRRCSIDLILITRKKIRLFVHSE